MRPLRIAATNCRSWAALDLDLTEGVTAVCGDNGAGKSTLVSIVDLALFGSGREMKRLLTRGAGEEEVSVLTEFEQGDTTYRVRRSYSSRGAGKSRLDLERWEWRSHSGAWVSASGATIDATQAVIEELVGLTRETFRASSYLAQGDGAAFTAASPRNRKDILFEALGIREWDELRVRCHVLRRAAEDQLSRELAAVEALEARAETAGGLAAQVEAAKLEATRHELAVNDQEAGLAQLEEQVQAQATAEAQRERLAADVLAAQRARDQLVATLGPAQGVVDRYDRMQEERPQLEQAAALHPKLTQLIGAKLARESQARAADALREQFRIHDAQARSYTKQADTAIEQVAAEEQEVEHLRDHGANCPTCGQDLRGEALERARESARDRCRQAEKRRDDLVGQAQEAERLAQDVRERLDEKEREVYTTDALIETIVSGMAGNYADADIDGLRRTLDGAGRALEALARLAEHEEEIAQGRADLAEGRKRLAGLEDDLARAEEALAAAPSASGLGELRQRKQAAETALAASRRALEQARGELGRAEGALEATEAAIREGQMRREALRDLEDDARLYRLGEKTFGRDGIPAFILETRALPQLEAEANRLIGELGRPGYRFELRTTKLTQAGEERETLDIYVLTEQGEAAYEDFSGGERTRLDLALRISLARLLANRSGAQVDYLAIDEPAYLDAEGFEQLGRVLRDLVGEFGVILVVSHVPALRDAFDNTIEVAGGAETGQPSHLRDAA